MPVPKNKWRGLVRGNLRLGERLSLSLERYHVKHDPAAAFLTDAELATVIAFGDLCTSKLNEKK